MQLPSTTTLAFTGHRRLVDPPLVASALHAALDGLEQKYGPLAAVSSAASGADTLFLEEVARRGISYSLLLPFAQARFRQDFNAEEWDRVAVHFTGAVDIEEIRDCESDNEAYLECGLRTVDRCDILIAVWNGEPAAGKGGTGDIVAYARSLGKPLIWIHATTGERQAERLQTN